MHCKQSPALPCDGGLLLAQIAGFDAFMRQSLDLKMPPFVAVNK
jgi:hypothetical protein